MSDNSWRIKRYYRPRVLIDLAQLEDSPLGPAIVCLTGPERSILQNLLEYAHRRSTFVSEYHDDYYLAPSEEEWDDIDALVAELEDKMSGCPEIVTLLEGILAATECACEKLTGLPLTGWPAGGTVEGQPDYDDYQSPVIEDQGEPPGGWETWDAWRVQKCISAQKLIDDIIDRLGDMNTALGAGIVLNFAAVMAMMIVGAFVPPIVIVLAIAAVLAQLGLSALTTEGTLWLSDAKQDIVCAIFNAESTLDARTAVMDYIDEEWDVEGSPAVIKYMLNWWALSHVFDGNMPGYEDWSGDYSAAYCTACTAPGEFKFTWNFPPDTDWSLENGAYYSPEGWLVTDGNDIAYSPCVAGPVPGVYLVKWKAYMYGLGDASNGNFILYQCETDCAGCETVKTWGFGAPVGSWGWVENQDTRGLGDPYLRFRFNGDPGGGGVKIQTLTVWVTP